MTNNAQFQRLLLGALNRELPTGADDPPGTVPIPPGCPTTWPPGTQERDRKKFPPGDPPGQPPPVHSSIRPPGTLERDRKKFPPGDPPGQTHTHSGKEESILHNTTGNRFLMPPPNIWGRQRTINKSGYWRVRFVADVKGPWNRGSGVGDKLSYLIKTRDSFTGGTLH